MYGWGLGVITEVPGTLSGPSQVFGPPDVFGTSPSDATITEVPGTLPGGSPTLFNLPVYTPQNPSAAPPVPVTTNLGSPSFAIPTCVQSLVTGVCDTYLWLGGAVVGIFALVSLAGGKRRRR